jgi:hypothetical protein
VKKYLGLITIVTLAIASSARAQVIQDFNHPFSLPSAPQPQSYQTYNNGFGSSTTYGSNGFVAQTYSNGFGGSTTYVNPGFARRGW